MTKRVFPSLAIVLSLALTAPGWAQSTPTAPPATTPAANTHKAKVGVIRLTDTLTERPESFSLSLILSGGKRGQSR